MFYEVPKTAYKTLKMTDLSPGTRKLQLTLPCDGRDTSDVEVKLRTIACKYEPFESAIKCHPVPGVVEASVSRIQSPRCT